MKVIWDHPMKHRIESFNLAELRRKEASALSKGDRDRSDRDRERFDKPPVAGHSSSKSRLVTINLFDN